MRFFKGSILLTLTLLATFWASSLSVYEETVSCDGVVFHDVYFDKKLLFSNYGRPYNLVMHKYTGILFFSHTIQNGTLVDFVITACHLEKNVCRDIAGVPGGYAIAYDSSNDDIYFGGHDGLYKYNFLTRSAEFFAEKGKSIWGIFIKRNFYYIEYPEQKLYVYQNDVFVKVAEAINIEIDNFFISKHHDIYFSNKTALYKIGKTKTNAIIMNDDVLIRQIVEDGYGDVYFCGSDGVYLEAKPYVKTKKIAVVENMFGITFDENDKVIYSDEHAIYRLENSNYSKECLDALLNVNERKLGSRDLLLSWM
uniref:Ommochrome-binding protein n=1 Tax=Bombyx mori TaxID=7091 RepID=A0A8R2R650_BOMMO|nr:ommochrome-binding protein-like isoform X1 [Bombyx mori]XP_037876605.1 ommochrome-binding protein-like isoform X1 [Bombyx mori]